LLADGDGLITNHNNPYKTINMKKYTYLLAAIAMTSFVSCDKGGPYTCECISGQISGNPTTETFTFHNSKEKAQEKCDWLGKDAATCGASCRLLEESGN
jgi:hypothetical protein